MVQTNNNINIDKNIQKEDTDDFYNETNIKHLMESIKQIEEGKVIIKTMKELIDMENE